MFAVIDKKENIFKRKKESAAYFIKADSDNIYYSVTFYLDMQLALKKKIKGFTVYATNLPSIDAYQTSTSIFEKLNFFSTTTAVASTINYEKADMANYFFIENDIPRAYITLVDPKINFDKFRYKNNRHGTDIEKFGAELKKVVNIETQPGGISMTGTILSEKQPGPMPGVLRSIRRRVVSEGLTSGRGLIEIMSYGKMKKKSRLNSHVITVQEQEEKEFRRNQKVLAEDNNLFSHFEADIVRSDIEESVSINKKSRRIMRLNTVIKIPIKRLREAGVDPTKFYLAFEAIDASGVITLDTNLIEVNFSRDKKYSKMSLKGLSLKGGTSTSDEKSFLVSSEQKNNMRINFYHKCIAANIPLLANPFYPAGSVLLTGEKNSHEVQISRKTKFSTLAGVSYITPPVATSAQILRATPEISGVSFDNCVETGVVGSLEGKRNTIPFYVVMSNNSTSSPGRNAIIVNVSEIDPDIFKIRPVKKKVTVTPYASSRSYRPVTDERNRQLNFTVLEGSARRGKTITFYDYDVHDEETYDYRLEIVRKPRNTTRAFTSNNFIEKYEKPDGSININVTDMQTTRSYTIIDLAVSIDNSFKSSAYGLIQAFNNSLGGSSTTFSLFSDEIQEVTNSSQVAIVLIAEKINNTTGQAIFIENMYGNQNTDGTYTFRLEDYYNEGGDYSQNSSTLPNAGYTYKFTPCSAPVAETLSAVRAELQTRLGSQVGKKLNVYQFAGIQETLSKIDTPVLSEMANKFSRGHKKHVLVDVETQSARNNGNVLASSSTGDVLYVNTGPQSTSQPNDGLSEQGLQKFKRGSILYYPCLKETKNPTDKFNNMKMSHKFIIEFFADFQKDIDHSVIFSLTNNKLNYECTIHPDFNKQSYRALIETNLKNQRVSFYMYCVKNTGKVLQPILLGSHAT